jgi:predicted HTH domain antitoxin
MTLTITLPDEVAAALGATTAERQQSAREAVALELYREGKITLRTMGKMAGVDDGYWAAEAFRVSRGVPLAAAADCADEPAVRELLDR